MTSKVLLVVLFFSALVSLVFCQRCSHDQLPKPEYHKVEMKYPQDSNKRQTKRENIRFIPLFDWSSSSINANQQNLVEKVIVPQALAWLSERLKVTPIQGPYRVTPRCRAFYGSTCASDPGPINCGKTDIPSSYYGSLNYCPNGPSDPESCVNTAEGSSTTPGDYLLVVNAVAGSCEGSTAAFASHCAQDQNDRPVLGFFTICPRTFDQRNDQATPEDIMRITTIVVHEISHALGFSSTLFPYFRDENNQPRVQRKENGYPVSGAEVGAVVSISQERGHEVTKLITPAVVAAVRDYFNCDTLTGAELEDQGGPGSKGSHWEERIFYGEYMISQVAGIRHIYSMMTAALFRDSGWYDVDYSQWNTPVYGWKAGCPFAQESCLKDKSNPVPVDTVHFCSPSIKSTCSADRMSTASCASSTFDSPLPEHYQYFANAKTGISEVSDFCPRPHGEIYVPSFGYDCIARDPSKVNLLEKVGPSSRCVLSTLVSSGYVTPSEYKGRCYPMTCNRANDGTVTSVTITVGSTSVNCDKPGDVKTIQNTAMSGSVVCPYFQTVCPSNKDCPNQCKGFGTCENGKCICFPGFTGDDCSTVPGSKKRDIEMISDVSTSAVSSSSPAEQFSDAFNTELVFGGYSYSLTHGCVNATNQFLSLFPIQLRSDLTRAALYFDILKRLADFLINTMETKSLNCFPRATVYVKDMTNPGKPALFYDNLEDLMVSSVLGEWSNMGKRAAQVVLAAKALRKFTNVVDNTRIYTLIPDEFDQCDPLTYNEGDGCDCECGAVDPDCNIPNTPIYNCYDGPAPMCKNDTCSYGTLPSSWTCDPTSYAAFDGCDCDCGAVDPDCAITPEDMFGCPLGDASCSPTGTCIYQQFIPLEWSCGADSYNNSRLCNCGCDAWDPDCDNAKILNDCPCPIMTCKKTSGVNGTTYGVCTGTCQGVKSLAESDDTPTLGSGFPTSPSSPEPTPAPTSAPTSAPGTCGAGSSPNNVININFAGMLR